MESLHPWTKLFRAWAAKPSYPGDVAVAHGVGVSTITIHNWKHGGIPRGDRAAIVQRLSGGMVPASLAVRTRAA
jgi:hypothetical protein